MELAEVYRIQYEGPDDKLRGIILCKDGENGYQYLFKDEHAEDVDTDSIMLKYHTFESYKDADQQYQKSDVQYKQLVRDSDHIIPNSRIKSSIRAKDGFLLNFYMFGVFYEDVTFDYPSDEPQDLSAPLTKNLVSRDGFRYLTVFYAIFKKAVEAHVKVTLTNNSDPFKIYGIIAARTSAIKYPAYSSLIFCKRHGEEIEVANGDNVIILLSRDIVAVPLGHQLILEFSLHDDNGEMVRDDNVKMLEDYLIFDAIEDGTSTDSIRCSKGELQVEVTWKSTREPMGGAEVLG